MAKSTKCRGCKRELGYAAEKLGYMCPRCQKDQPNMIDASEEEGENNENI